MEFVIIGAQYKRLAKRLELLASVEITKVKAPYVYFQYRKESSQKDAINEIKSFLNEDRIIHQFVYEVYGFYNGKIDIASYLPDKYKEKKKYYK